MKITFNKLVTCLAGLGALCSACGDDADPDLPFELTVPTHYTFESRFAAEESVAAEPGEQHARQLLGCALRGTLCLRVEDLLTRFAAGGLRAEHTLCAPPSRGAGASGS